MNEKLENEEVKETEEKIEEVETVENTEKEEKEKHFYNMQKMNCDYKTYKIIRAKHNMPVVEKCKKCNKKFKDDNMLYTAYLVEDKKTYIICGKCANQE